MFRVNRADLLQVLARVEPGRSSKNFLEQSSCYVFGGGSVSTFNEEICCRTKSGLPVDFEGAVHGKPLKAALEIMSEEEIDFEPTGNVLKIHGRRREVEIRMESEILLPFDQVEQVPKDAWVSLDNPEDFAAAIKTVVETAGTDAAEYKFCCVHVSPDYLESCDRRQASKYNITTGFDRDFLVRAKSLAHVAQLGMNRVASTDNWAHFRNKLLVFSCRRDLQEYPDMAPIWEFTGSPATLPRGATEAAKLCGVFSGEDAENDRVTVVLADNEMQVRGEGAFGRARQSLETAYRGAPVSFRISPVMLGQLVQSHTEVEIGTSKLRVIGEKWRYTSVLGKVTDTTESAPDAVPVEEETEPEPVGVGDGD